MKEIANNLEDDEVSMDVDSCSGHGRKQNVIIVCKIF